MGPACRQQPHRLKSVVPSMKMTWLLVLATGLLAQTGAERNGELLLRDFKPKTRLDVKETRIVRAKFPVIDVHFHMSPEADPLKVVETMDQLNLQMVVNLGNHDMWGETLKHYVDKWVTPFPSRFAVMANIDPKMVNDPEFAAKATARLKEDVKNGAIALKIYKDLGLVWRNPDGSSSRRTTRALIRMGTCADLTHSGSYPCERHDAVLRSGRP